jgi:hypothetical protein
MPRKLSTLSIEGPPPQPPPEAAQDLRLEYPQPKSQPASEGYNFNQYFIEGPPVKHHVRKHESVVERKINSKVAEVLVDAAGKVLGRVTQYVYDNTGRLVDVLLEKVGTKFETMTKKGASLPKSKPVKKQVRGKMPPSSPSSSQGARTPTGAIVTAPVAYGNVLAGKATISRTTKNGHVASGREFCFAALGSGTIDTWTVVGGAPLTPVAFVDSRVRMYGSMYTYFRFVKLTAHYVTTSSTSSTGSVMFYYNKDRASVFLTQTSPNLLPFVLSDPHTMITPQWQNISVNLECDREWMRTDFGNSVDMTHFSSGELFLLSKTATSVADSPGMVLFDYEIEFKDENLTPRLLLWPQPTIFYFPVISGGTGYTATVGNVVALAATSGTNPFDSANTNKFITGGVYKSILDMTHSVNTTGDNTNLLGEPTAGTNVAIPLIDGTTLYTVYNGSGVEFYVNAASAFTGTNALIYQTGFVAKSVQLLFWHSLAGFISSKSTNPSM